MDRENDIISVKRREIDSIDEALQGLFEQRMHCAQEIARYKAEHSLPIFDEGREKQILDRRQAAAKDSDLGEASRVFFQNLLDISKTLQERIVAGHGLTRAGKIAFQGVWGAFSEQAVMDAFGETAQALPCDQFEDVIAAVEQGTASHGVLPVENSTGGAINEVYDLLGASRCHVVGETVVQVQQCLMAVPGVKLSQLRRVYSHPQGLRQCRDFLREHNLEAIPYSDTAAAAEMVARERNAEIAAIASRRAARHYGLEILADSINDRRDNYTRFVVISLTPIAVEGKGKASIAFTLRHESGSLHAVLTHLATCQYNMTKLESRNIPGNPWEYRFYLDFEGDMHSGKLQPLLSYLEVLTGEISLLGVYLPARRES